MTEDELAKKLHEAYHLAPKNDKALQVMLFAITYADTLHGHNSQRLCALAEIPKWGPQINLGRKLAEHVNLKK